MTAPDTSWMADAACRDMPTAVFFSDGAANIARAKAACERCPVRDRCHALVRTIPSTQGIYGVWGGETPDDRGGPGSVIAWARNPRTCIVCGDPFTPNAPNQKCCGETCVHTRKRQTSHAARRRGREVA